MNLRPLVRASRAYGWDKIELRFARERDSSPLVSVMQPAMFFDQARGLEVRPAISFEEVEAQMLMDELYAIGLRPTEGRGSVGALGATKDHLEDMKKIAFLLLNKETE
jgi:hypothetical protein